jgi:hypothetical protein
MLDDEIDYLDEACPRCGQREVRQRGCDDWGCDEGWIDEHDDDPINFSPGEEFTMCRECLGTGVLRWCAGCGLDITRHEHLKSKS